MDIDNPLIVSPYVAMAAKRTRASRPMFSFGPPEQTPAPQEAPADIVADGIRAFIAAMIYGVCLAAILGAACFVLTRVWP